MKNFENHTGTVSLSSDEALYDLGMLEEMEDNEYLVEVLTIFLNETPLELKEMKEALTAGNWEAVAKKAHKMKSSAGIIQAEKLVTLLDAIEKMAKAGSVDVSLNGLFENVRSQYSSIEQALKNHIKELG